jgi:hypothetical protein
MYTHTQTRLPHAEQAGFKLEIPVSAFSALKLQPAKIPGYLNHYILLENTSSFGCVCADV